MKRFVFSIVAFAISTLFAFADYSSHGRPWDIDDDYDSSRGLWFLLFVLAVGVVFVIGAIAKGFWNNHKESIKEGIGTVAIFGGCIFLFLAGKECSEQHPKDNGNAVDVNQLSSPAVQYETGHPSDLNSSSQESNNYMPSTQPRYKTEFYDERCSQCNGSGSVVCSYCGGRGYISVTCSHCGGRGSIHVKRGGHNFLTDEWETFETDEMCTACFGKGVIDQRCSRCNSEYPYGNHLISTYMTCPTCHGQGVFHRSKQVPY